MNWFMGSRGSTPCYFQRNSDPRRNRGTLFAIQGQVGYRQEDDHRAEGGDRRPEGATAEGQHADWGIAEGQHQPQATVWQQVDWDPKFQVPDQGHREQESKE